MQVTVELYEYLLYMKELGFGGLAVDAQLFEPAQLAPPPFVRPGESAAPAARPAHQASLQPPPAKPRQVPKAVKATGIPNLSNIMDMISAVAPVQDTRQMAAAVVGQAPVEILRGLYSAFSSCQACALGTTRNRFVFGEGPPQAQVMFVGSGPGRQENLGGRPFIDEAGQLLDKIIKSMGMEREQVFLTNVVKCHPPEGRQPLPDEVGCCSPLLIRQIETVNPRVIVSLGSAINFFKGPDASLQRNRGQMFPWRNHMVMPTFHPAYILRNPRSKREVWEDIKQVMTFLGLS